MSRRAAFAVLLVAIGAAVALALGGHRQSVTARAGAWAAASPPFTLMQMNLCLSGLAGCFGKVHYPAVVDEAVARIRASHPDAITVNEACRTDAARIGRRTGYRVRFSPVVYLGERLRCIHPAGRGLFGDAVLVRAAVEGTEGGPFRTQSGIERRGWLCVGVRGHVDVCTAHLNTRVTVEVPGNDAQCHELGALLARRAAGRAVIFGGDVNRRGSCAPRGFWTRTDAAARQSPGLQHVYGSAGLRPVGVAVVPAVHTDHDVLLVRAQRTAARAADRPT